MKKSLFLACVMFTGMILIPSAAQAADPDWKSGRIYFRLVCTACHTIQAGGAIAPNTRAKSEWAAYFQADKHAKGKDSISYYVSKAYRDSIKSANKAAAKFADIPEQELLDDIRAYVTKSAKDGDAPAGCS